MPSVEPWLEGDIAHALDVARRYGHNVERSSIKVTPEDRNILARGTCTDCGGSVKIRASRALDLPSTCRKQDLPWKW